MWHIAIDVRDIQNENAATGAMSVAAFYFSSESQKIAPMILGFTSDPDPCPLILNKRFSYHTQSFQVYEYDYLLL